MNQAKRQKIIMELVKINGEISSKELAKEFNVSMMTISRDLNELSKKGKLILIHGGAKIGEKTNIEEPMSIKELTKINEKKNIGKYCSKIIPSNSSVFIETGTTTLAAAREIYYKKNCTFYTNSLLVMNSLSNYENINLHSVPGRYRDLSKGFMGIKTVEYVQRFNFDYCIIAAEGVDADMGVTLLDEVDAFTKIAVMKNSKHKILVADSSKFKQNFMYKIGDISAFDYIITDDGIDKAVFNEIKKKANIISA